MFSTFDSSQEIQDNDIILESRVFELVQDQLKQLYMVNSEVFRFCVDFIELNLLELLNMGVLERFFFFSSVILYLFTEGERNT